MLGPIAPGIAVIDDSFILLGGGERKTLLQMSLYRTVMDSKINFGDHDGDIGEP